MKNEHLEISFAKGQNLFVFIGKALVAVIEFTLQGKMKFFLSVPDTCYIEGYGLEDRRAARHAIPPTQTPNSRTISIGPDQVYTVKFSSRENGTFNISYAPGKPQIIIDGIHKKDTQLIAIWGSVAELAVHTWY